MRPKFKSVVASYCNPDPTRLAAVVIGSITDIIGSMSRLRADFEPSIIGSSQADPELPA